MLHGWLNRPHVRQWWGEDYESIEAVMAHFNFNRMRQAKVTPYVGLLDGVPFAYAQSYVAMGSGDGWWKDVVDPGIRGIDQFIAGAYQLDHGLGTRLVSLLIDQLFADPEVTAIQTDPAPDNLRAIRCYEKAGFRQLKRIVTPHGAAVYMWCERPN